jgi:transcriptional regulator with XRE-family HTH domain
MADEADRGDKKPRAGPVDAHVGARIRLRRTLLKMTQETLGEALGVSFQQVQKYEGGVNRVGSARLHDLSRVLDVPISYFFDDMAEEISPHFEPRSPAFMVRTETLELVRAYDRIPDAAIRKGVFDLIKALSPE